VVVTATVETVDNGLVENVVVVETKSLKNDSFDE
jgi:hypothetical protein